MHGERAPLMMAPVSSRRINRWLVRHLGLVALCAAALTCSTGEAPPPVETPQRQFVLERVRIDERLPSGARWSGIAERAEGDLSATDVSKADVTFTTADGSRRYHVRAPAGTLTFDDQLATFRDVKLTADTGGVLEAPAGRYEGAEGKIRLEGPLRFAAEEVTARASSATVDVETGVVRVEGPVVGRYVPGGARR